MLAEQTVQAALQLQEAHQQQAEELELAKADRDILVEQNRELIETTHKQKKEVERVTQRNDRLRQENQQLAQGLDEKKQMEKEVKACSLSCTFVSFPDLLECTFQTDDTCLSELFATNLSV